MGRETWRECVPPGEDVEGADVARASGPPRGAVVVLHSLRVSASGQLAGLPGELNFTAVERLLTVPRL